MAQVTLGKAGCRLVPNEKNTFRPICLYRRLSCTEEGIFLAEVFRMEPSQDDGISVQRVCYTQK